MGLRQLGDFPSTLHLTPVKSVPIDLDYPLLGEPLTVMSMIRVWNPRH